MNVGTQLPGCTLDKKISIVLHDVRGGGGVSVRELCGGVSAAGGPAKGWADDVRGGGAVRASEVVGGRRRPVAH